MDIAIASFKDIAEDIPTIVKMTNGVKRWWRRRIGSRCDTERVKMLVKVIDNDTLTLKPEGVN